MEHSPVLGSIPRKGCPEIICLQGYIVHDGVHFLCIGKSVCIGK